jgi:glucose-1-phosphatase
MANHKPVRALIWDAGGVLVRNLAPAVRGRLVERYGMTGMDLENLFFNNEMARKASLGQAREADAWEIVRQKLNLAPEEMPQFIETFWSADGFDEDLYAFTMSLKPRYRVGLLSNAMLETRAALAKRFPKFFDMFDVTVFSAEEGLLKPDARIYRLILDRLGVEAPEAVFVDDFIENVEGARRLGLIAIHFRNPQQAVEALKEFFS